MNTLKFKNKKSGEYFTVIYQVTPVGNQEFFNMVIIDHNGETVGSESWLNSYEDIQRWGSYSEYSWANLLEDIRYAISVIFSGKRATPPRREPKKNIYGRKIPVTYRGKDGATKMGPDPRR